ncbi:MAG TPA: 3-dehydroquinate synthase [Gammaproteobacteria bacterium]
MSGHTTLTVDLGERSYPIEIGRGLRHRPELFAPAVRGGQVVIVSNETVAPLYLEELRRTLSAWECHEVILPDGERFKTLETVSQVFDALLARRCERSVTLVALGGGVIGDITGFAAACYQRGVPFIQVPTTLLAQVDSSVGGKTGVNHPLGKNMIGAFHQPNAVIIDTETLGTLELRQLRAGLAEVIKYGLIRDPGFFSWLELNCAALLERDDDLLAEAIARSCRNKAAVVADDEREAGQRALLNLGHTFGHAIETAVGYGEWLHGEAVAVGTALAADLSVRLGWLQEGERQRILRLLAASGLPLAPPAAIAADEMLRLMALDKKVSAGQLRLVLLRSIGQAVVSADYASALLQETLLTACSGRQG